MELLGQVVNDGNGYGYRLIVMGDLNGKIEDGLREGVSSFGMFGENDNGMKVVDFCIKKNLFQTLSSITRTSTSTVCSWWMQE